MEQNELTVENDYFHKSFLAPDAPVPLPWLNNKQNYH
jgi:hypothetical protein